MKKKEVLKEISLLENEKKLVVVKGTGRKAFMANLLILFGAFFIGALGLVDLVGENHAYAYGFAIGVGAMFAAVMLTQLLVKIKVFRKNGLEKITT